MNVEQAIRLMDWAREISARIPKVVVITKPHGRTWKHYLFDTPEEARQFFDETNKRYLRESWIGQAYFIARNGVIMAQRRIAAEAAEGDE